MVILGLETATRGGSAALFVDGACEARAGDPARTHGERLPGELLALLSARGLHAGDVDRFAIVAGPGSFTGLRVGMATIQGLALVTDRLVAAVPTLEAMVEAWRLTEPQNPRTSEPQNLVVAALDGQRGDIFFAAWRTRVDLPVEQAESRIAPSVGQPDELVRQLASEDLSRAVLVGIGLDPHAGALASLRLPAAPLAMTLAEAAVRMAARRPDLAGRPHALRPIYLRRPDAVLVRERAAQPRP